MSASIPPVPPIPPFPPKSSNSQAHDELSLAAIQRSLEHQIIREIIEAEHLLADNRKVKIPSQELVVQLRKVCQQRGQFAKPTDRPKSNAVSQSETQLLARFSGKTITTDMASTIVDAKLLQFPARDFVTWYNDTNESIQLLTFDENDTLRWVRFEERTVSPQQVLLLTALGHQIQVLCSSNGTTYDCCKGRTYLFDGKHLFPKLEEPFETT